MSHPFGPRIGSNGVTSPNANTGGAAGTGMARIPNTKIVPGTFSRANSAAVNGRSPSRTISIGRPRSRASLIASTSESAWNSNGSFGSLGAASALSGLSK